MNLGFSQYGQLSGWGDTLTKTTVEVTQALAWDAKLNLFIANVPNPRGYYCREVLEKAIVKAETVRNKAVLSSSSFNGGVTVGRTAMAAQLYYKNDSAMKSYSKAFDNAFVSTVDVAVKAARKCAKKAGYQQLPSGEWAERKLLGYIDGKSIRGRGAKSKVALPGNLSSLSAGPIVGITGQPSQPDQRVPVSTERLNGYPSNGRPAPSAQDYLTERLTDRPAFGIATWQILLGVAVVGGGAFFLYRRRKGKSA
mgnify:CR=1 FL=1